MSEVRANGGELDGAAQLLASAHARVAAAIADLALPEAYRLSDRQRFTLSHLLGRLVGDIEDELRSALAAHFAGDEDAPLRAALSSASLPIAMPVLEGGGALDDLGLSKRAYVIDMGKTGLRLLYMDGQRMKKHKPARPFDRYVMYTGITMTGVMIAKQLNTSAVYDIA